MDSYDIFCQNAKARLDELEWNQGDLAEQMGVSQSYVSQILSGRYRTSITLETLDSFADGLNCDSAFLLTSG